MRTSLRRWSVSALLALAAAAMPATARAQDASTSWLTTRVSAVVDAEVCACEGTDLHTPRLRDLAIVTVGWRFPLVGGATSRLDVAWSPELIPFLYSSRTASARLDVYSCGHRRYCARSLDEDVWTVTAYGAGVMPLGFTAGFRASERVRLRTRVSAGAVQLTEPVPLAQGTKFNFVADGGVSLEVMTFREVAVSGGIGLNHISNGGLGRVNLGMDSRMIEIGVVLDR